VKFPLRLHYQQGILQAHTRI